MQKLIRTLTKDSSLMALTLSPLLILLAAIIVSETLGKTSAIAIILWFILALISAIMVMFNTINSANHVIKSRKYSEKMRYQAYLLFWSPLFLLVQLYFMAPVSRYAITIADILAILQIIYLIKEKKGSKSNV
jgi:hypothetical protein